jgi:hypothetical protein
MGQDNRFWHYVAQKILHELYEGFGGGHFLVDIIS